MTRIHYVVCNEDFTYLGEDKSITGTMSGLIICRGGRQGEKSEGGGGVKSY